MKWEQKNYFITRFNGKLYFVKKEIKTYNIKQLLKEARINLMIDDVVVKNRVNGAKIKTKNGNKEVKKLFQELKVPTWERDNLPFIYYNEVLVSVGGIINNPDFQF